VRPTAYNTGIVAIYHLSAKPISRATGRTATGAAAYRAGENIADARTGLVFDYRKKGGVDHKEIMAPANAPEWAHDRAKLWNAVEASEKRKDSQVAREVVVALPTELNLDQQRELVRSFAHSQFVNAGMVADVAIHHSKSSNPHAHILLTMRDIGPDGFGQKNRSWNDKALLQNWRQAWEVQTNGALAMAGQSARIDHRTLVAQGINDRLPSVHLGPSATAIERRGEQSKIAARHDAKVQEFMATVEADAAIAAAKESAQRELVEAQQELAAAEQQLAVELKIQEVKDDRVRAAAIEALAKSSRATDRAISLTIADQSGIVDNLRAASGDLGRAVKGAERRVSERHYGRVVEAVRDQFERVGGVVQQVANRVSNVVRTVAAAAQQVANIAKRKALGAVPAPEVKQAASSGVADFRAQFEQAKLAEAGKQQARQAFEQFKAEQQAQQRQAELAKEQAAQALAKQREAAERKQQPKRGGDDGPDWSR